MAQSIKISDDEMALLQTEAKITNRTITEQAEHWLQTGRTTEYASAVSRQRLRDALAGAVSADDLTAQENELFFDTFSTAMWDLSEQQQAFFAHRKQLGLGVGLNEQDQIIHQMPETA